MMNAAFRNLSKLGVAGATIAAIGWGILTLNTPEEPVREAEADVWMMDFAPRAQQEKFVETLMVEGLEEPRRYNLNGNEMFFSTTTTDETPSEVLQRFQRAFVETGVNKHVHMRRPKTMQSPSKDDSSAERAKRKKEAEQKLLYYDDFFGGGIVPTSVSNDHVMMAGMESEGEADDALDFVAEVIDRSKSDGDFNLHKNVGNMRFVDAYREGSGKTRITAVWSTEDYEIAKLADEGEDLNVDPERPACVGCTRLYRFEGSGEEEDYDSIAFNAARRSPRSVIQEYRDTLGARGWKPAPSSVIMANARRSGLMPNYKGQLVSFSRGAQFLTLMTYPDSKTGDTIVHLFESR